MKRILSYTMVCIYATIMVKPVMPTITDIIAHIFNYSDHIATVHHHGGNTHVHNDYIEAAKKGHHNEMPYSNSFKKIESSSEHLMFTTTANLCIIAVQSIQINVGSHALPVIFFGDLFRPPILFLT